MHFLRDTEAVIEVTVELGAAAEDAVDVKVTDAVGRVVASGPADHDPVVDGRYTFTLDPQPNVASLETTWTGEWGGVEQIFHTNDEIVGSHLFTIAELRAFDDQKLSDATKYPDALLAEHRDRIADDFEEICNVSFISRYAADRLDGTFEQRLMLMHRRPTKLIAVSINDQALDVDALSRVTLYDSGKIWRASLWPANPVHPRNVVVEYEHGWKPVPAQISRAAKVLARYEVVARDISDRTLSLSNELGTVRLSVPGINYPTGIPVVDAALARYDESSDIEAF